MTDGLATMGPDPVKEADKLKGAGIEIFVFSIGRSIRRHLDMLASSEDHVFECESFAQFQKTFDDQGKCPAVLSAAHSSCCITLAHIFLRQVRYCHITSITRCSFGRQC